MADIDELRVMVDEAYNELLEKKKRQYVEGKGSIHDVVMDVVRFRRTTDELLKHLK